MDKIKTGELIAAQRKLKGLTQQDIADKLYVTCKAVSKWECGHSFPGVDLLQPLAKVLDISVIDLLSGEIVPAEKAVLKAEDISVQAIKKEGRLRRRFIIAAVTAVFILLLFIFYSYAPVIFQRGNPLPYLSAAFKINDDNTFVEVFKNSGIYISKKGDCTKLFEYVINKFNVQFSQQAGSGYIFTNGLDNLIISSEIYWGKYTVWQVP